MKLLIAKDYEELSVKAFEVMKEVVITDPCAVLGLATGTTPLGLYRNVIEDYKLTCYFRCDKKIGRAHV